MTRTVHVQYFAVLREQAGRSSESVQTAAIDPEGLYEELRRLHGISVPRSMLRVAVNEEFSDWLRPLEDGDRVVFIPPVAGG
jgi:molybdopterin converting factor subunit 1